MVELDGLSRVDGVAAASCLEAETPRSRRCYQLKNWDSRRAAEAGGSGSILLLTDRSHVLVALRSQEFSLKFLVRRIAFPRLRSQAVALIQANAFYYMDSKSVNNAAP